MNTKNAGPGCSSIAYGAAQELGPFLTHTNSDKLTFNDFSWNKGTTNSITIYNTIFTCKNYKYSYIRV